MKHVPAEGSLDTGVEGFVGNIEAEVDLDRMAVVDPDRKLVVEGSVVVSF